MSFNSGHRGVPSNSSRTLGYASGVRCRRQLKLIRVVGGSVLAVVVACGWAWGAPQDRQQGRPHSVEEFAAFQAADDEKNSQTKIKLLDDFSVKYPDSALLPEIYRDYYLVYLYIKNYPRAIEYADKFVAFGDKIDRGDRLEALITRAQAFLAGCSDPTFETPEFYASARAKAIQGLQTVSQFPIPDAIPVGHDRLIPDREHFETLFYAVVRITESGLQGNKNESCSAKRIAIENIKLFSQQQISDKRKYEEFQEFRETKDPQLFPSARFEVVCELRGEADLMAGDFLLWTAVDFFLAPVPRRNENMESDQIGPNASWYRSEDMQDLKPIPIYSLRPSETRRVVIDQFDLTKVLASFPVGSVDNLWPWFVRLKIHVQDRNGRQIGSAERIVRLSPDFVRRRAGRPVLQLVTPD
jgi:hypothetical protein